jgi:hypothetical protein
VISTTPHRLFQYSIFALGIVVLGARASGILYVNQRATGAETNGQSWSTAYRSVQAASVIATGGDEVWVAAGTYLGSVQLKAGVALYGGFAGTETIRAQRDWNVHRTILDGQDSNNVVIVPVNATAATRLDGFTLLHGRADYGAGVYCAGGSPVFANNTIVQNNATGIVGGGGILADTALDLAPQTPLSFFTNVAERLLETKGLRIDHLLLYPTNEYSAEVHRLLQVAANLYDATTHRGASNPCCPSVFRPVFASAGGNMWISGFVEADNAGFATNRWLDLAFADDRAALADDLVRSNGNVFGQPVVMGAIKGLPNFNEFELQTDVLVARRLQAFKLSPQSSLVTYRQSYEIGISNSFGVEAWNAYTQAFSRPLELRVTNHFQAILVDRIYSPPVVIAAADVVIGSSTNFDSTNLWNGREFRVPLSGQINLVPNSALFYSPPYLRPLTNLVYDSTPGFPVPELALRITNSLQYILIDQLSGRVLDFVNLEGLEGGMEFNQFLASPTNAIGSGSIAGLFWLTNRDASTLMTFGITNQIFVSTNDVLSPREWSAYSLDPITGSAREKVIDDFRKFLGLPPLFNPLDTNRTSALAVQVPFTPARRLSQTLSWQVNDPLVHYHAGDLYDPIYASTNNVMPLVFGQASLASNLGQMNRRYRPWGGRPGQVPNQDSFNTAIKDPFVGQSDDWEFPEGSTVNLQWLDRLHRGTPWQTLYFASSVESVADWARWSGSAATHPTNDWQLIELFLGRRLGLDAASVSSASPLLANNTIAANNAAGNGSAICIPPGSTPTLVNNIVAFNSAGILKQGPETVIARTNCVFANVSFDYSGLPAGAGDIAVDPEFIVPAIGNFDLLATSPCIDAGDESVFSSAGVFDEPARRQGARVEIGAFELGPLSPPAITDVFREASSGRIEFKLKGLSGGRFAVETSINLTDWIALSTNSTANGFFQFSNTPDADANERFYRARRVP